MLCRYDPYAAEGETADKKDDPETSERAQGIMAIAKLSSAADGNAEKSADFAKQVGTCGCLGMRTLLQQHSPRAFYRALSVRFVSSLVGAKLQGCFLSLGSSSSFLLWG